MTLILTESLAADPQTGRHRGACRGATILGYVAAVAITVGVSFVWFAPAGFVAAGDEAPYVRASLATELWSSWNHQTTGAGSASYASVQALDVVLIRLAHLLGFSPVVAEHALFALCFGLAAFGTAFLAGAWVRHPVAVATAGLIGVFNTYLLVNQPNVLPALAIGLIGTFAGALLRAARRERRPSLAKISGVLAGTLAFSYLALNPPLLAMSVCAIAVIGVAASALVGRQATRRATAYLGAVGSAAVLLNLWWIVPMATTIFGGTPGTSITAQTNVAAWTWTQARTSLPAVATLNGHWGWTQPEYYPYSNSMESGIWPVLAWLLPLLALVGVIVADRARRVVALSAAGSAVVLLFLSKGVHAPFGSVNLWLFQHVAGMWLFRDPMSKLGALLVLLYALLAAIAVERVPAVLGRKLGRQARRAGLCGVGLIVVGALAFPWPLWTGAVFPSSRGALPGEHVTIPSDWYRLASLLNAAPGGGKVLILPLDPYYQVSTTWGYHGADTVPAQLLTRPVLQQLPGGYFSGTPGFNALLQGVQSSLLGSQPRSALSQLRALGVSHIVLRHDLAQAPDLRSAADAAELEAALTRISGVTLVKRFKVANVYQLAGAQEPGRIVTTLVGLGASNQSEITSGVASLAPLEVATTDPKVPVGAVHWQLSGTEGEQVVQIPRTGSYQLRLDTGAALYQPEVRTTPTESALVLSDATSVMIDGWRLPGRPSLTVPISGSTLSAVSVNGVIEPIDAKPEPIDIDGTSRVLAYGPQAEGSLITGLFSDAGNCDRRPDGRASTTLMRRGGDGTLTLTSFDGSACAWAPIDTSTTALYQISLQYRVIGDATPRVCLWQVALQSCAATPVLEPGDGWQTYTGVANIGAYTGSLRLYLYSDNVRSGEKAEVQYGSIGVVPLRQIGSAVVRPAPPPSDAAVRTLTAGRHVVSFGTQQSPAVPTAFSHLQNCDSHEPDVNTVDLGVTSKPGGTLELRANSDSACIWTLVASGVINNSYSVKLDYRTVSGRPARVCVWEVGPNTCLPLPPLDASPGWHHLSTTVRPDTGTRALDVYLYADGNAHPTTLTQYRDVAVSPDAGLALNIRPAPGRPPTPAPPATWQVDGPARYTVRISDARGPFVVELPESYASGWRVSGLPTGWSARHIEVDGYANGWAVSVAGSGDATLTLSYVADRWTHLAELSSAIALVLLAFGVVVATARRRMARVRG